MNSYRCNTCDKTWYDVGPGDIIPCEKNRPMPNPNKNFVTSTCNVALVAVSNASVVEQITTKRGSVYGPFFNNAIVAQNVKDAMHSAPGLTWGRLPFDVREALDLIALKISRIVTGDPEYLDNWDDIGGYAKIVADRIRAKQEKKC